MYYKKLISLLMILVGAILAIAGSWSLTGLITCPEETPDCEGWAILGGYIFIPASVGFLIGGITLIKNRSVWYQLAPVFGVVWLIYLSLM